MRHNESYEEFVAKFNNSQPKTTDDCYTPKKVYEFVRDYFVERFDISEKRIVRPFYPGGDYENEDYTGAVVIDNPPFSILTKIVAFYQKRNIPFVMFCSFSGTTKKHGMLTYFKGCPITYENGAKVGTAFVTNIPSKYAIVCDTNLIRGLQNAQKKGKKISKSKSYNEVALTRCPLKADLYILKDEITGAGAKGTYGTSYMVTDEAAKRFHEARGDKV